MKVTTAFSTREKHDPVLTGNEDYEIQGDFLKEEIIRGIFSKLVGLNRFFDCDRKAKIAAGFLPNSAFICFGSLMIQSSDLESEYGFHFNPPLEFHCWLQLDGNNILDLSLPGVIENGLTTADSLGPFLIGRTPTILNGKPLDWMLYRTAFASPL